MRREWNPEMAFKAYIDTIRALHGENRRPPSSGIPELVAAMAAGWNARTIVETYNGKGGDDTSTSIALSVARGHTSGRHVCIVPDEETRSRYVSTLGPDVEVEVMVAGEKERTVRDIDRVDFVMSDPGSGGYERLLLSVRLSCEGAVLLCKNSGTRNCDHDSKGKGKGLFGWMSFVGGCEMKIVRDVWLPIGKGLDVVHVVSRCCCMGHDPSKEKMMKRRWIKHVDRTTGEEIIILRR